MAIGKFGACIIALVGFASIGLADDFEKGIEAARAGDFETAFNAWMPLAENGDPAAQYNIGRMYRRGDFVNRDDAEAANWYLRAAERGLPVAQMQMGFMYANGFGVSKDLLKGMQWSSVAAENGDQEGQDNLAAIATELGWAYMGGLHGLAQDPGLSCVWFTIGGEFGDKPAAAQAELLCSPMDILGETRDLDAIRTRCVNSGYHDCE